MIVGGCNMWPTVLSLQSVYNWLLEEIYKLHGGNTEVLMFPVFQIQEFYFDGKNWVISNNFSLHFAKMTLKNVNRQQKLINLHFATPKKVIFSNLIKSICSNKIWTLKTHIYNTFICLIFFPFQIPYLYVNEICNLWSFLMTCY